MSDVIELGHVPDHLIGVIEALCGVGRDLSKIIARGSLGGNLGGDVGTNSDGDGQKALDVMADEAFAKALRSTPVRYYASEEREEVVTLNPDGNLALAIDPLDGSSNIDVNVSIGTIFSIFPANADADSSFLRPASEQIAAGYIIYGPQTQLVVTFGDGVQSYLLDPETSKFVLLNAAIRLAPEAKEFAINASNMRHWTPAVRRFIDDCLAGVDGPFGRNHNMRWIASLVAETHRILARGGVFLYPSDARKGYEKGRLRRVYECAPIAFLIEQAGGKATDGVTPVLSGKGIALHERMPFVFGAAATVDKIADYHLASEE